MLIILYESAACNIAMQSSFEVTFMIPVSFSFSKAGYSMPVTKALLTATTTMMMAKTFSEQKS